MSHQAYIARVWSTETLRVSFPVTDPGFSQGGANPQGTPGYDFIKFSHKMHEMGGGGGRAPVASP